MNRESNITLTIREIGTAAQRTFMFNILLEGKVIVSNQNLSPAESQAVRDFSRRYSILFEQRTRQPRITSDTLKALGTELFKLWLAQSWSKITKNVPVGTLRSLVIASDVADILNLPWELLRPPKGDFLGFDLKFSIRRLPLPDKTLTAFVGQLRPRPLRILFMACAPRDQQYLNYEREEEFLFRAIEKAGPNVVIDSGDMGSFEELRQRINEFQPHIVHLTGHGIVGDDGLGYFAFEDEQGKTDLRSSVEIRQQLFAGSSVQCAFISGCQTGKAPPVEALGGICQGLVGDEVPLAIGWAASIADSIAIHFAAIFYNTLAAGQPVDRALTQARQAIRKLCEEQGDPSWTLPVLYNATAQRLIFDPRSLPVPPLRKSMVQRPLPGMTEGYATQFIGRRRELQELLPAMREGSLQTVLITGLGGAGKSTLATRIARKLEIDDFIPIPVPSSKDNPLSAARLMQICNDAFLAAGQRDAHFTLSDSRLSVNDRLRYIITVLNNNRFLLVLDNFEVNIDESTRKILDSELAGFYTYMISNLVGESRAIITSRYRPADVQELPSIAQERILGDFSESSFIKFLLLDEIVEQRYYKGEIPLDLLSKLYDLLGGTPRFLGQIREVLKTIKAEELRSQLEAVTLPSKEKRTLLQQTRDRYCEDIFTSRLYGYLNFDSQKALSRVAVYAIPVNLAGMKAVTGEPEEKLRSFTREWQDFALAYPEHEWVASELWTVYGLLRNWLLAPERLSPDDRKAAHKAAGDFLNEMVDKNRTSELGMHLLYVHLEARAQYMFAGDYENATEITERISGFYRRQGLYREIQRLNEELLQYYEHPRILAQIARSYLDRSSYAAAQHWYQRMLDAADGTDGYEAARALQGLATIDLRQGNYETAREKLQKALERNQQIGDRDGEASTLHQLATIDLNQGEYETAREIFQSALELFQQIGDRDGEAYTLHNLATIDLNQGEYETAREIFQKALEIRQQIGDMAGEASTLHQLATIDLNQGEYETAREIFQSALEIFQQIGDRAGEAYTLHQLASIDLSQGEYETAREIFQKALEIRQQIGDRAGEASTLHNLATIDLNLGDYETAREIFQRALEIRQQIGDRAGEAYTLHQLASIDLSQGEYETAREIFQKALEIKQQIGDRDGEASTLHQLATIDLNQGEYETAREIFQSALEIFQQIGDRDGEASTLHQLASIDLNQGEYETAREIFQKALEIKQQIGDRAGEASTLHNLASIDLNLGEYETAREIFQSALEIFQQIGDRAGEAYTLHNLATIDLNQGEYETAREIFQKALEIRQQIGDRAGEASTLHNLASIDLNLGDYETAREIFQSALEIFQQIGDRAGEAYTLHNLATIDLNQGEYETAREIFQKALEIKQQIGDRAGEASTWYQLGMLATKQDRMAEGIKLVAICFLIKKSIDHADTESDFRVLTGKASQLNYTEEQFNLMLKEVMEAYKKDRGSKLLEMAFLL